jgi:hypothetical protein
MEEILLHSLYDSSASCYQLCGSDNLSEDKEAAKINQAFVLQLVYSLMLHAKSACPSFLIADGQLFFLYTVYNRLIIDM